MASPLNSCYNIASPAWPYIWISCFWFWFLSCLTPDFDHHHLAIFTSVSKHLLWRLSSVVVSSTQKSALRSSLVTAIVKTTLTSTRWYLQNVVSSVTSLQDWVLPNLISKCLFRAMLLKAQCLHASRSHKMKSREFGSLCLKFYYSLKFLAGSSNMWRLWVVTTSGTCLRLVGGTSRKEKIN